MVDPPAPLQRGDLCRHGCSTYPVYAVISTHGGRAWVRDISSGAEAIVSMEHCNLLEPEEARRLGVKLPADLTGKPSVKAPG
jgi:hypothetical protein